MISDCAIRVENLGKRYQLGQSLRYRTLRDTLGDVLSAPRRWLRGEKTARPAGDDGTFWALKDISFEIKPGEVVGIIGRNGAGKSTLLKILSRITEPTEGGVDLYGRVGSLLEVGTGFHPELTGRENIYLNGAILGMKRAEIARKFDEIVAFAEIEKFLDTSVKFYSSGMYMRLAFAVAAHLEPEILLVDEVLAVGDAGFQKKCLGKMGEVARQGRTVLLVSHNMAALQGLCGFGLLLDSGRVAKTGDIALLAAEYLAVSTSQARTRESWFFRHRGSKVTVEKVELRVNNEPVETIMAGMRAVFRIYYEVAPGASTPRELSASLVLYSGGQKIVNFWSSYFRDNQLCIGTKGWIDCVIEKWPFRTQSIRVDVYTHCGPEVQDWIEEVLFVDSHDGDFFGSGIITNPDQGLVFLNHSWSCHADR